MRFGTWRLSDHIGIGQLIQVHSSRENYAFQVGLFCSEGDDFIAFVDVPEEGDPSRICILRKTAIIGLEWSTDYLKQYEHRGWGDLAHPIGMGWFNEVLEDLRRRHAICELWDHRYDQREIAIIRLLSPTLIAFQRVNEEPDFNHRCVRALEDIDAVFIERDQFMTFDLNLAREALPMEFSS